MIFKTPFFNNGRSSTSNSDNNSQTKVYSIPSRIELSSNVPICEQIGHLSLFSISEKIFTSPINVSFLPCTTQDDRDSDLFAEMFSKIQKTSSIKFAFYLDVNYQDRIDKFLLTRDSSLLEEVFGKQGYSGMKKALFEFIAFSSINSIACCAMSDLDELELRAQIISTNNSLSSEIEYLERMYGKMLFEDISLGNFFVFLYENRELPISKIIALIEDSIDADSKVTLHEALMHILLLRHKADFFVNQLVNSIPSWHEEFLIIQLPSLLFSCVFDNLYCSNDL